MKNIVLCPPPPYTQDHALDQMNPTRCIDHNYTNLLCQWYRSTVNALPIPVTCFTIHPGLLDIDTDKTINKGVIDLTLPSLSEEEYPLPVRSICLYLFRKTLYHLGRQNKRSTDMQRCCNIIRNLNLVHILWTPHRTLP